MEPNSDSDVIFGLSRTVFTNILATVAMVVVIVLFVWMPGPVDQEAEDLNSIEEYRKKKAELETQGSEIRSPLENPQENVSSRKIYEDQQKNREHPLNNGQDPESYRKLIRGIAAKDKIQYKRLAISASSDLIDLLVDSRFHLAMAMSYLFDTKEPQKAGDQIILMQLFLERASKLANEGTRTLMNQLEEDLKYLHSGIERNERHLRDRFERAKTNLENLLIDTFKRINERRGERVMPESRKELSDF